MPAQDPVSDSTPDLDSLAIADQAFSPLTSENLELLPETVSCPCTKRERRPPWLSFVRGAGAQLLQFSKELSLFAPAEEKAKAFLNTSDRISSQEQWGGRRAGFSLPANGAGIRTRWRGWRGEQENSPGGGRGTGKLAQQQQPPPKQMGMEKTARKSRCLKGGRKKNRAMASILVVPPPLIL